MRVRVAVPEEHVSPDVIDPVLEAVTRLNEHMITSGQTPTSHELIRSGAVWRPEPMGDEHFDHGGTIAARGWGDCDDWAPLHAATLRTSGEDPGATARVIPSGPNTFHAIVQRTDGSIDDPSEAAGMRAMHKQVIGGGEAIEVYACDPHDGRVYQGSLLPTVGPLSVHCGPQLSVRGCHVIGQGDLWQGRVDMPLCGSPLVGVSGHHRRRHHRRRVHGALPYAMSVTHLAGTPAEALSGALCGAVLAADAAELATALDRYKLLAVQSAMAGMGSEDVRNALYASLQIDFENNHPGVAALLEELGAPVLGDFLSDVWTLASSIVLAIGSVMRTVVGGSFLSDAFDTIATPVMAIYNAIPAPIKAVLAPATLVTEYAYAHPDQIPMFGALASKAKDVFTSATSKGASTATATAQAMAAVHPTTVPATHAPAAHVLTMHLGPAPKPPPKPAVKVLPVRPQLKPLAPAPHAAMPVSPAVAPHPVAAPAPALVLPPPRALSPAPVHLPGIPPGATHWHCAPLPDGHWACNWQ